MENQLHLNNIGKFLILAVTIFFNPLTLLYVMLGYFVYNSKIENRFKYLQMFVLIQLFLFGFMNTIIYGVITAVYGYLYYTDNFTDLDNLVNLVKNEMDRVLQYLKTYVNKQEPNRYLFDNKLNVGRYLNMVDNVVGVLFNYGSAFSDRLKSQFNSYYNKYFMDLQNKYFMMNNQKNMMREKFSDLDKLMSDVMSEMKNIDPMQYQAIDDVLNNIIQNKSILDESKKSK